MTLNILLCLAVQEEMYMRHLFRDLGYLQQEATPICENHQASMKVPKNDIVDARKKYIQSQLQWSSQGVKSKQVKLIRCPTELMSADALTTALSQVKFQKLTASILTQDKRIGQSGSVEDPASAVQHVLKQAQASWSQAQGSGSIIASKSLSRDLDKIQIFIPSSLIEIARDI